MRRGTALLLVAAGALGAAGCGSSGGGGGTRAEATTPAQARTEIAAVRAGLDRALETYRSGDRKKAVAAVGGLYADHFAEVERLLGRVDPALEAQLRTGVARTIRERMDAGDTVSSVAKVIAGVQSQLDAAAAKLR